MFIAARLSPPAESDLERFVQPRRAADSRLRWVRPEQWHLTTAFLPEVPEHAVEPLIEDLRAAVAPVAPFPARLSGGGFFGRPQAARVFWLGLSSGAQELARLSRRTRNAANRVGAPPDGARFTAHLTVARVAGGSRVEAGRWLRILDTYQGPTWTAEQLWLISSHLGAGPAGAPRHQTVAGFPLGSGRDPGP